MEVPIRNPIVTIPGTTVTLIVSVMAVAEGNHVMRVLVFFIKIDGDILAAPRCTAVLQAVQIEAVHATKPYSKPGAARASRNPNEE